MDSRKTTIKSKNFCNPILSVRKSTPTVCSLIDKLLNKSCYPKSNKILSIQVLISIQVIFSFGFAERKSVPLRYFHNHVIRKCLMNQNIYLKINILIIFQCNFNDWRMHESSRALAPVSPPMVFQQPDRCWPEIGSGWRDLQKEQNQRTQLSPAQQRRGISSKETKVKNKMSNIVDETRLRLPT